jgi:hypothetical protein
MNARRIAVTLLCAAGIALPAAGQRAVNETHAVAADATVTVSNISGSVRVVGGDRSDVHITGTLGRGIEKLEVTGSGSRLDVRVIYPRQCEDCGGAEIELAVPAGVRPEVQTVSADIDVSGVRGDARVESVSGSITLATAGSVRAKSVSGEVTIRGGGPRLHASSVSGDVEVTMDAVSDAELETVSGNVRVASALAPRGRLEATSVSGNVEVALPAGTGADVEVESFSGAIRNALSREAVTEDMRGPGRRLQFVTGDGSARVYLKSFSGNVRINKK